MGSNPTLSATYQKKPFFRAFLLPERKWRLAVWWGNINMRLAHHLQRHPSGVWHFRMTVPRDLRALLGLRYIKKSLRTRDPMRARLGAYTLSAHYAQIFARIRRMGAGMARDSDGKQGGQRPRPRVLRTGDGNEVVDYVCKINPDGSASIEATGPEDHALAMEAWAEMSNSPRAFLTPGTNHTHENHSDEAGLFVVSSVTCWAQFGGSADQGVSNTWRTTTDRMQSCVLRLHASTWPSCSSDIPSCSSCV